VAQALSGERDDFDHLRSYEQSDAMSLIYWPSVAKGEMLSKAFIYEQATHFFALDYDKAGHDHESRLSQLTKWVLECERKGADFSLKIGEKLLESTGGVDAILAHLATR
jgi:trehalose/maltose hydrolase-like predicted phosphorylase